MRAESIDIYRARVPASDRRQIKDFCLEKTRNILDAISPKRNVVIGLQTLDMFEKGNDLVLKARNEAIVRSGKVFGRNAHAVKHLTGARLSNQEYQQIKAFLRSEYLA